MPSAEEKYREYKRKLQSWEELFEEQYGTPPTDDDCHNSSTWTALLDKVRGDATGGHLHGQGAPW